MPEILAPCGSMSAFYAAIEASADAIYLAGKMFGARGFANNFTNQELEYVIKYAHLYGVKVYVTCNILIYENEVGKFLEYVEFLVKNNVDAIIMQDLGMISLIHQTFPNLELHGSTQMNIHSLSGALMAQKLGLKRIVLARETPLATIKEIKEKTNLEIEIFVHGSLCASYSGMCLFSASIGPRSGNRGTCSGCCRLPYKVQDEKGNTLNKGLYPLSMCDLMTIQNLDKLINLNITSFKIEGRMKGASYVYTTVKLYKETRDNYLKTNQIIINQQDLANLKKIFYRGVTKGFLFNASNNQLTNDKFPNHQGVLIGKVINYKNNYLSIKLSNNIAINDGLRIIKDNFQYGLILNKFTVANNQVYQAKKGQIIVLKVNKQIPINSLVYQTTSSLIDRTIQTTIAKKNRKVPINFIFKMKKNQNITLTVNDEKEIITLESIKPELAKNQAITKEIIKEKLNKVNNTIYTVTNIQIDLDDNLFIPIKIINNLKQDILELLTTKRLKRFEKKFYKKTYHLDVLDFPRKKGYTLLTSKKITNSKYTYIYSSNNHSILKIPKVVNSYAFYPLESEYLIGELGGLNELTKVITDYSFNIVNSYGVALLHSLGVKRVTLSLELNDKQIKDLIDAYYKRYFKRPNLELIVKTRMEIMILKFKLKEKYPNAKYLVDRFNNKYEIKEKSGLTYLYDYKISKKTNLENYFKMGINYLRDEDI